MHGKRVGTILETMIKMKAIELIEWEDDKISFEVIGGTLYMNGIPLTEDEAKLAIKRFSL
jgi:hypothetical protein